VTERYARLGLQQGKDEAEHQGGDRQRIGARIGGPVADGAVGK